MEYIIPRAINYPKDPEYLRLFEPIKSESKERADYLVVGDWLEEHDEMVMAYAFRWMARKRKRPFRRVAGRYDPPWVWIRNQNRIVDRTIANIRDDHPSAVLHPVLFDMIHQTWEVSAVTANRTCQEAINMLALALDVVRQVYSTDPS